MSFQKLRPTTQCGIKDLLVSKTPLPKTCGTFKDCRFYCGKIKAQINVIKEEANRLQREISKSRSISANKLELHNTAKERANLFDNYQKSLRLYNNVIDFHMTEINIPDIKDETEKLRKRNENLREEVDHVQNLIPKREKIQETLENTAQELDEEDIAFVESISDSDCEHYSAMVLKNKEYINKIEEEQRLIENERNIIIRLKNKIKNNKRKLKKVDLWKLFTECIHQKEMLANELEADQDPKAVIKERLKKLKNEIQCLDEIANHLIEEIREKEEEIISIDQPVEDETNIIETLEDMKNREEKYLSFLSNIDEDKMNELQKKVEAIYDKIDKALFIMKRSCDSFELYDLFDSNFMNLDDCVCEEIKNRVDFVRNIIEKQQVQIGAHKDEIIMYKTKITDLYNELDSFFDSETKQISLEKELDDAKQQHAFFEKKSDILKVDIESETKEMNYIDEKLNQNYNYNLFIELEKKLEVIEKEIKNIEEEETKEDNHSFIFQNRLREVGNVVSEYQAALKERIKNNHHGFS